MQNEPNLRKDKMNLNLYPAKNYEDLRPCVRPKNKPNSKPIKPNFKYGIRPQNFQKFTNLPPFFSKFTTLKIHYPIHYPRTTNHDSHRSVKFFVEFCVILLTNSCKLLKFKGLYFCLMEELILLGNIDAETEKP